jgi:hypothetical protein
LQDRVPFREGDVSVTDIVTDLIQMLACEADEGRHRTVVRFMARDNRAGKAIAQSSPSRDPDASLSMSREAVRFAIATREAAWQ